MTRLRALLGIVAISFSAIFVRLADVSAVTAALFRTAYALPVLLVIRAMTWDGRARRARLMAFGAGLLLAVDLTLWHTSIHFIGAGLATVVANVQVVWVGLVGWLVYRERPTATALAVIPVVLVGIALVGGLGSAGAFGDRPLLGATIAAVAGVTYAGFLLLFRASNQALVPTAGPLLDATAGAVLGALLIAPFDAGFSVVPSWPSHGWLVALAVVSQSFGWLLISSALPRLAALETSVMLLIQPAATIVWARIIFAERLSVAQWLGVLVVLAGVLVAGTRGAVRTPAITPRQAARLPDS
jgi:drug/metabolite transporter (DMT)-like permease